MSAPISPSSGCECNCHPLNESCEECLVLHGLESLERQNIETSTKIIRLRGTDEEIGERQNKIISIMTMHPDTTQEDLADALGVSISTIQRDMATIKQDQRWVDNVRTIDVMYHARLNSLRIDNQISRLQKRIDEEDLDPKTEAHLMEKINNFAKNQFESELLIVFEVLKKVNKSVGRMPLQIRSSWYSS